MKKLLQGAVLPFIIFTSGVLLLGCNQPIEQSRQHDDSQIESAQNNHSQNEQSQDLESTDHDQAPHKNTADLKQGNMFYIARDVANVQLKTGDYVEK